ncbi:ATP-NAD kinase family protein [Natrialba sp. INN-245]|uniref:ATP-NAD kinase family protein n=1 Tax=Natrialba sp. INN-245 TaxID=2690967 RepID=UPI001310AB61|nr:ATP-NAD kinase family protein [Natrialba sp. INN-245]MWV39326.1 N-acetylglucosamine-1-phosphate uridyltransferase [Natrialba sp. INN-245]
MESIGVVVNPIAGMGGRVGLKGTDDTLEEAKHRGAEARAPDRAREALESLFSRLPTLSVYTAAGVMGEYAAVDAGYEPEVVYDPSADGSGADVEGDPSSGDRREADGPPSEIDPAEAGTTAADTHQAVRAFLECGVDLILFVGGDGTATDVATTLEEEGADVPILGVPAGVKIYSSVFAVTPGNVGRTVAEFDRVEPREVNDIDEAAYREGEVKSRLEAVADVPVAPTVQSSKQLASGSVDTLAEGVARDIDPDRTYVFGPGGTVGAIEAELEIDASPLGVDVWRDGELLVRDGAEADVLEVLEDPVTIVVSPIGGQGFVFGRGNHQISPAVIDRADDIEIVATGAKLDGLEMLRTDTDDESIDEDLRGWTQVRTGRFTTRLIRLV